MENTRIPEHATIAFFGETATALQAETMKRVAIAIPRWYGLENISYRTPNPGLQEIPTINRVGARKGTTMGFRTSCVKQCLHLPQAPSDSIWLIEVGMSYLGRASRSLPLTIQYGVGESQSRKSICGLLGRAHKSLLKN